MSAGIIFDLAEHFNAKRIGKGWMAKCPAHDDRKPSLSIDEGGNGRVLLKCHSGCELDAILAAAGLTKRALFPGHELRDRAIPARTRNALARARRLERKTECTAIIYDSSATVKQSHKS